MGPAILLCPSSSAAHIWGHALPPTLKLKQKDGSSTSISHRFSASTGDLTGKPTFLIHHPASGSEKCRKFFTWRRVSAAAAAGSEVSVEEAAVVVADAEQTVAAEPSTSSEETTPATDKTPTRRTLNRSNSNANKKAVVVSPAELVPGAIFAGKVVSIQSFGAFIGFGAFTNGLVHISRLSRNFVKKVEDVVQVGQDVKVQVLEVDFEANRISLMLIEEAKEDAQQEEGETQPQRASQSQTRAPRRDSSKRLPSQRRSAPSTTLKKGEIVTGIVKNMIKSGVFLSLPDGTDGYLPTGEVIFKTTNTNLEAQFQIGEEVTVRVLRIERGRVNLTMKREVNFDKLNEDLNKGVIEMATNPFELAFRRNELIANYLSERDKLKAQADEVKEETADSIEEVKDVAAEEQGAGTSDADEEEATASGEAPKDMVEEQRMESSVGEGEKEEEEEAASVKEVKGAVQEERVELPDVKEEAAASVKEVKGVVEGQRVELSDVKEDEAASVEEVKGKVEEQRVEPSADVQDEAAEEVKDVAEEQREESSDVKEAVTEGQQVKLSNVKVEEAPVQDVAKEQCAELGEMKHEDAGEPSDLNAEAVSVQDAVAEEQHAELGKVDPKDAGESTVKAAAGDELQADAEGAK